MISALSDILHSGITLGDERLSQNGFARRLLDFIYKNKNIPDEKFLLTLLYRDDFPDISTEIQKIENDDVRIKNLLLHNVRQYSIQDKSTQYYSIDFTKKSKPTSLILHGANGSGKTTVFSALEFLYLGKSKIAEFHGHESDSLDFFRSVNALEEDLDISGIVESNVKISRNRIEGYEIPAAFCSESDYFEITRNWRKLNDYLAYEMGYGEMFESIKKISKLSNLLRLSYEYRDTDNLLQEIKQKRKEESNQDESKRYDNKKSALIQNKTIIRNSFIGIRGNDYKRGVNKFSLNNENILIPEIKYLEIRKTLAFLEEKWTIILEDLANIARSVFQGMMGEHLFNQYESIEITTNEHVLDIKLKVKPWFKNDTNGEIRLPVEYFNTFRLKLFCVAFKMSLYCCAKIKHNINLPFVIDDIFDSSDFNNRSRIGSFIKRMVVSHNESMSFSKKNFPIQLIFFTQDNIIGENIFHGLRNFFYDLCNETEYNVTYGRLFVPRDSVTAGDETNNSTDLCDLEINGKNMRTIRIVDPLN